jgi:epothilone polyketide synthase D
MHGLFPKREIKHLRAQSTPIAIVGIGCRFPGNVSGWQQYWDFLSRGGDGICEVPPDRWDLARYFSPSRKPGNLYVRKGGFLSDLDRYDAAFFGISPREAAHLDPQQRLLLEVAWETFEDAGILPSAQAGRNVGVYIGLFNHDYESIHHSSTETRLMDTHSPAGIVACVTANRLSYLFDFRGPSMAVDTACSSSLVAIHLACRSLESGESELALAGGVNVILKPEVSISLCSANVLSPDGYCKSFDASANGYARAEGVGLVLLKRLDRALADGDPIHAVIRGTAINQDGKTDGISAPNPIAQAAAIRTALEAAGLEPERIGYVEAHGTGTAVGDPIEAQALSRALCANRHAGAPCIVGSVKSNFGHTESAAGVAGLIKAALCLKHRKIPANLHFETPNPRIPFERWKLRVPTELEDWTSNDGLPRVAAVNSFGFGGANAHAIVEEAPDTHPAEPHLAPPQAHTLLFPVSARTPAALVESAQRLLDAAPQYALADIARTLTQHRTGHPERLCVAASSHQGLLTSLDAVLQGAKAPGSARDRAHWNPGDKIAFVYSGMGSQWPGMGLDLLQAEPAFRQSLEKCDALFRKHTREWRLLEELNRDQSTTRIHETRFAQCGIFSVQVALTELLLSRGVVPDLIAGHSAGEVLGYYAAGALTLEDAVCVCFHRSRLHQTTAGKGRMLAVALSETDAAALIHSYATQVSLAAVNSASAVTLAGDAAILESIRAQLENRGIFARFLAVEVPYHSPAMDPILEDLEKSLRGLAPRRENVPVISTVTGDFISGEQVDARHWMRNVRQPVYFQRACEELFRNGCAAVVEIGPHPVLATSLRDNMAAASRKGTLTACMRRNEPQHPVFLGALAQLYCAGYPLDWTRAQGKQGRVVHLPTYSWQRESYWNESEASRDRRIGPSASKWPVHPLLGFAVDGASGARELNVNLARYTWLPDHIVRGAVVFPATGFIEAALARARFQLGDGAVALRDFEIKAPLVLSEDVSPEVQIGDGSIASRNGRNWTTHASWTFRGLDAGAGAPRLDRERIMARCPRQFAPADVYSLLRSLGLEYGPAFHRIENLWMGEGQALARIPAGPTEYFLHPCVLDASLQAVAAILGDTFLPVKADRVDFFVPITGPVWAHVQVRGRTRRRILVDTAIFDDDGNVLFQIVGLHSQLLGAGDRASLESMLHEYVWVESNSIEQPTPPSAGVRTARYVFSCDEAALVHRLSVDAELVSAPAASACTKLLELIQGLVAREHSAKPELTIVISDLSQASLWGLGRVAITEHGKQLAIRMVDMPAEPSALELSLLALEILSPPAPPAEDEIRIREEKIFMRRLRHAAARPASGPFKLRTRPGENRGFEIVETALREPGPGEVLVRVLAAPLNFKDMLKLTGALSDSLLLSADLSEDLGLEIAGVVEKCGDGVHDLVPGDEVFGFTPGALRSHVVVRRGSLMRKPAHLSFEEAATMPLAFQTASYALEERCHIRAGDRVLIHAATGAVGLAAIQVAKNAGARIYATSRSPEKRAFLSALDLEFVCDSTADRFAEEIIEHTNGEGVDIVLSGLTGNHAEANLRVLRKGTGQLVEVGNIYDRAALRNDSLAKGASLHVFDHERMIEDAPAVFTRCMAEVGRRIESGELRPLPFRVFPFSEAGRAFEYQRAGAYIGKIVLAVDPEAVRPVPDCADLPVTANGSYLLTGGLGGFGMATARRLVEWGARHLILIGRSGAATPEAVAGVRELEAAGARVVVERADVADADALAAVLKRAAETLPPLRGVIHGAMVLRDVPLAQMTAIQMESVLQPKVAGAWNLHRLTKDLALDFFVLYSSVSSMIGNVGQANYAAANSYLDALAEYRRAAGLPGTSICWGPIESVGVVAGNTKVLEGIERMGLECVTLDQAWKALSWSIRARVPNPGVMRIDWGRVVMLSDSVARSPRFAEMRPAAIEEPGIESLLPAGALPDGPEERRLRLERIVVREAAKVFGLPDDKADPNSALDQFGLDSLMAMELSARLEKATGIDVPQMTLMRRGLTLAEVAASLGMGPAASHGGHGSESHPHQPQSSRGRGLLAVVQQGDPANTPFAFIVAGYGDIWAVRDLAALLGSHQTVYALYPPRETVVGGSSIRDLAALYASELREVQPEGPYLLGGYSAGALIGIEVARSLRQDGDEVPYLALFDPNSVKYTSFFDRALRGYFSRSVLALAPLMERWHVRSWEILAAFVTDKGLQSHFQVLGDYQPEPYPGEMTLFRASQSRWLPYSRIGGFKEIARGGLRVHVTPGNHHTFIRHPHVVEVAARLDADLRAFSRKPDAELAR